jgi:hypothetical protein
MHRKSVAFQWPDSWLVIFDFCCGSPVLACAYSIKSRKVTQRATLGRGLPTGSERVCSQPGFVLGDSAPITSRVESLARLTRKEGGFRCRSLQGRCRFLSSLALAAAPGLAGIGTVAHGGGGKSLAVEPPPEITTIRLERDPVTCITPQVVEELLRPSTCSAPFSREQDVSFPRAMLYKGELR